MDINLSSSIYQGEDMLTNDGLTLAQHKQNLVFRTEKGIGA